MSKTLVGRARAMVACACVCVLSACGTTSGGVRPSGETIIGQVWDARTGAVLALGDVLKRLEQVDVVLVGEEHGKRRHHEVQREVAAAFAYLRGVPRVVIAVEWLPASSASEVRKWLAGDESADALREATHWDTVWGHSFASYAPVFEWARSNNVQLVPINANPILPKLVARGGTDAVQGRLREQLPPLDSGNEAHKAWFKAQMAAMGDAHPGADEGEAFENLYLAQVLWDETMAKATIELAERTPSVIVFAGLGHTQNGLGIPARLGSLRWLVVRPVTRLEEVREYIRDAPFPERDADLLWMP